MLRGGAMSMIAAIVCAACTGPAPTHALIVRHPERKCALIRFSGCALLLPPEEDPDADADAGIDTAPPRSAGVVPLTDRSGARTFR